MNIIGHYRILNLNDIICRHGATWNDRWPVELLQGHERHEAVASAVAVCHGDIQ